jgi:predicted ribosome quality control (RQC) complex YloA/Tae2 family protein
VIVPEDFVEHSTEQEVTPLVEALKERIQSLERQLEREQDASAELRRIVAGLVNRIPELPPPDTAQDVPAEARQSPQTASEEPSGTQAPPQEERRSWWQRWFGAG